MSVDPGGPFVNSAVVCERVLVEQDGVASVIRVIDRLFFTAGEQGEPIEPRYPLWLLVTLKAGAARGSYTVSIVMEKPSTERVDIATAPVLFEGDDRGINLIMQMVLEPDQQGLYWYDVLFEGERLTRIPLRVVYQTPPRAGRAQ
jgi:hypothetical protein